MSPIPKLYRIKIRYLGLGLYHIYTNTYVIFFRDQDVWFAVTTFSLQVMQHNWKENNQFTEWWKDENHLKDIDGLVIIFIFRIQFVSLQVNTYKI
jgi:hypothetical protein